MVSSILVVDDDLDIRMTISEILRDEGFRVREARNGLEALEKIADEVPDVVILDLIMPVLDGWKVLQILRGLRRSLPVVILSAVKPHSDEDAEGRYIQKPVSYERLLRLLEAVHAGVPKRAIS